MTEAMESMANKISMALKDSVLQMGFEVFCKKIKELEEKITQLQNEVDDAKSKSGYICYIERGHRIKELEKENAELKKTNRQIALEILEEIKKIKSDDMQGKSNERQIHTADE